MTIIESRPSELIRIKLEFLKPLATTSVAEFTFQLRATAPRSREHGRRIQFHGQGDHLVMTWTRCRDIRAGLARMKSWWKQSPGDSGPKPKPRGDVMQLQPICSSKADARRDRVLPERARAEVTMLMRFKETPSRPHPHGPPGRNKVMHANFRIGETTCWLPTADAEGGRPSRASRWRSRRKPMPRPSACSLLWPPWQLQQPLIKTFFSSRFGVVADRFGVSWMVYVAP